MAKAKHICVLQGILFFSINMAPNCSAQENSYRPGQPIIFSSSNPAPSLQGSPAQSSQSAATSSLETNYAKPSFSHNTIQDPAINNRYGQFSSGYTAGSQFRAGTTAGSHFSADSNSSRANYSGFTPPSINYVRMPNGSFRANGPSVSKEQAFKIEQATPKFSGDVLRFVLENPPVTLDGNIENLLPSELHTKAYGKAVARN